MAGKCLAAGHQKPGDLCHGSKVGETRGRWDATFKLNKNRGNDKTCAIRGLGGPFAISSPPSALSQRVSNSERLIIRRDDHVSHDGEHDDGGVAWVAWGSADYEDDDNEHDGE